jgi:hypothetical protein
LAAQPLRDQAGRSETDRDGADLQRALPSGDTPPSEQVPDVGALERPPDELGDEHSPQHRRGSRVDSKSFGIKHDETFARLGSRRIIRTG